MINKFAKLFRNKAFQYILIILYGIIMVAIMTGPNNLYGSKVDWISQHTIFPDIFREHFYETGELVPQFLFNIGAGQNAFNFAYYGLLSPLILLSYLFPFVDMMTYMTVLSILLFVLTGILTKKFVSSHFGENVGFVAGIIILSMAPLNLHFHRHLMFVWYFPFLLLALIGLDRYFHKNKPTLFVISTFLLILTNYLYAIPCLFCLYTYAIYKTLQEFDEDFSWKPFIKRVLGVTFLFIIPVLMSGILLIPTAYSLLSNRRPSAVATPFTDIIVPRAHQLFFFCYSIGISITMFAAAVVNLTCKTLKKSDRFLSVVLVSLILFPVLTYAFNGFLYVRGKILIPFAILYIYNLFDFLKALPSRRAKLPLALIITGLFGILVCLFHREWLLCYVVIIFELLLLYFFSRKPRYIMMYTVVMLFIASVSMSRSDLEKNYFDSMQYSEITALTESIDGEGFFRTNVSFKEYENSNRLYSNKHMNTSVFSSTSNVLYMNFYDNIMGNNKTHYCNLVTAGTHNELFHTFMGTRYIISPDSPGFLYEKVKNGQGLNLYENKNCYPIAYKSSNIMSESDFDKTQFPYSLAYIMNNTIIDGDFKSDYIPEFESIDVPAEYFFETEGPTKQVINLDKSFVGKYLYLSFELDNTGDCQNTEDLYITINESTNLLSPYDDIYYNSNNKFEYVIPLKDDARLYILLSKGKFNIKNLKMYTSDKLHREFEAVSDFKINQRNSSFSCNTVAENGEYFVTSIPYDKNFKAFINGKETEIIPVNKAFMGIKLQEGRNNIEFRYDFPYLNLGYLMSLSGLLMFILLLVYNKISKHSEKN